jgi:hypothetical protein
MSESVISGTVVAEVSPTRILFGTCQGTKKDAVAIARSQIGRFMDAPELCSYFVAKHENDGYHYEVHQGGEGKAYLPSVLAQLKDEKTEDVILQPQERQTRVAMTSEGKLMCAYLSRQDTVEVHDTGVIEGSKKTTNFFEIDRTFEILSLVTFVFAAVISVASFGGYQLKTLAVDGYANSLDQLPAHDILQKIGYTLKDQRRLEASPLPLTQWRRLERVAENPSIYVSRLKYDEGKGWQISTKPVVSPGSSGQEQRRNRPQQGEPNNVAHLSLPTGEGAE